jgi:hypothetical protein
MSSKEMRLTWKTGDPAPEQEAGIFSLAVPLCLGATTLVTKVEVGLLLVVGIGGTVGFALVVATTTALLVSAAGADKRLLETHVLKFGLRAAFKSWLHLPNAW